MNPTYLPAGLPLRIAAAVGAAGLLLAAGVSSASARPAAASAQDKAFMTANAQTSLAEISLAQLNAQRSQDPATQALGRMTLADHRAALAKLTSVASSLGVTLPTSPNAMQLSTASTLKSTAQSQFDVALDTAEVTGHRMSIDSTNQEIASGTDPAVVAYAKYYLPVATKHLTMAADALQGLGGTVPGGVPAGTGGQRAAADSATVRRADWAIGGGVALLLIALLLAARPRLHVARAQRRG